MSSSTSSTQPPSKADWSATQYLKFGNERTRAVHDLVSQIPSASPRHIIDLGCGPGNSTQVLRSRYPDAKITGLDSSPDMLRKARESLPDVEFTEGDLKNFQPSEGTDLLFSNAVFHWLRSPSRIPTVTNLLSSLKSGGVIAFQVPDNYEEPSHRAMREIAASEGPWKEVLEKLDERPDLDPIESPREWYDALVPYCQNVNIWHTYYSHILPGPKDIVEWVRGTGLQPFVNPLDGNVEKKFLEAYEARIAEVYPRLSDGRVMLRYPRLFVVAVRK